MRRAVLSCCTLETEFRPAFVVNVKCGCGADERDICVYWGKKIECKRGSWNDQMLNISFKHIITTFLHYNSRQTCFYKVFFTGIKRNLITGSQIWAALWYTENTWMHFCRWMDRSKKTVEICDYVYVDWIFFFSGLILRKYRFLCRRCLHSGNMASIWLLYRS